MNYMIFLQKVPNDGKISNECLQNLFNTFTYKNNILIYPHFGGIEETEEIEALSKEFLIFDSPFQEIIELIIKCISRFLFIKAYQNSESIKENYFKQEFKEYHERYCFWNKSYIKLKTLGKVSGGMVELIYHICSESIYALKIPYPDKIKNNEREIENYLNLRHPNIVQYYGYFESDQGKYLILEYVEGKTLDKYDLTKLNFIEKNEIICDIICAVKYIHSKNYICRDLSLNNIIITENIKAIIIDFDKVIKSEEFQNENEPMTNNFGKLSTAPEINKTYQSDIFSIGYIMHYILHGEPPEIQTNDENGNKSIITKNNFLYKECLDIV
ncbi:Cell cycle serine/threonine-protein kinase cdc5/MSD2 [Tritrichomonas musculus]|uniref:Cell cycle serine/threonine-protein kinase cdc5/MSD2 n=1 Tax=Tritrichomonas musculus TaxID=1915356 RepID=A0ABR2I505_9EUKA